MAVQLPIITLLDNHRLIKLLKKRGFQLDKSINNQGATLLC
ncbi:MAG TPA: hypothetical protein VL022_08210 [Moheibacter sp.]|nr:hypothetical protein [Moheibacter sp.]